MLVMELDRRIGQFQMEAERYKSEMERYKHEAEKWQREAERLSTESEDFVACSREIEMELDKQLAAKENTIRKQNKEIQKLTQERDKYQADVVRIREELCSLDARSSDELRKLRSEKERLVIDVRRLEQINDDLERSLRITAESLKGAEERLNVELERCALLSTEVDSKDDLKEQCQRLEDELRDLKHDNLLKETKLITFRTPERNSLQMRCEESANHRNGLMKAALDSVKAAKRGDDLEVVDFGCRVSTLLSPLARDVAPLISNIQNVLEDLESKLHLMRPERTKN